MKAKAKKEEIEVSVVIPVFNEEANLEELIRRSREACTSLDGTCEVLLVDDGSSDRSVEIIEEAAKEGDGLIKGVILNRNYGQHSAVLAGFAQSAGEIVVTLDADLQNPPEEIPRMVEKAREGYDVVGSVRVPRRDSIFRRISSWTVNWTVRRVTGVLLHDYGCMLRAYRRPIVNAMLDCRERTTFIPILANLFSRHVTEIEVSHAERSAGESKYSFLKLLNLQFDLLTSMTTFPLRLLSLVGLAVSAAGMGLGVFLLVGRFIFGPGWAVQGVFTLFSIVFILIGAQFIGMGLLGEYLGRVFTDVRSRPRYIVDRVVGDGEGQ